MNKRSTRDIKLPPVPVPQHKHEWKPVTGFEDQQDERCRCGAWRCHFGAERVTPNAIRDPRCTNAAHFIWDFCDEHGVFDSHGEQHARQRKAKVRT